MSPTIDRAVGASVLALATMLLASGCGDGKAPAPGPARVDDAFVVRIVPHQHVAAVLAQTAVRKARGKRVRALARSARAMRRRTLPAFDDMFGRMPARPQAIDMGVPAAQAADDVTPQALDAARPFDAAFLTTMSRHDQGALALVQAELRSGRDPGVKAAAQRLGAELTRELARLSRQLEAIARRRG